MQFNELEKKWKKDFNETLKNIERLIKINNSIEEQEFANLAKWIVETDISTYDFLPTHYQNVKDNPFVLEMLLLELYHAMIDDGDVCFVTMKVDGKVEKIKMMFVDQWEDNLKSICMEENKDVLRIVFDHNKRMHEFTTNLNNQGKSINIPNLLSEKDIVFETHLDSNKFMLDVAEFVESQKAKMLELDERRNELLGKLYK